jgi:hypothetical protein
MRNLFGGVLCAGLAVLVLQFLDSNALAVSDMSDWTGENSNASNANFTNTVNNNNYGLISNTSVGGTIQSKINWSNDPGIPGGEANVDHVRFSDPTLDGPLLSFQTALHMEGTITFNNTTNTEPNICFCWYNSGATTHRIGLGISNLVPAENPSGQGNPGGTPQGAVATGLRIDVGFAASTGNYFSFVSANGKIDQANLNSIIPNGSYPFTFDYVPGTDSNPGGSMSATVGTYFHTTVPLGAFSPAEADYNNNNSVDAGDYVAFRKGGTLSNEVDNPGTTNAADYAPWRARYGISRKGALSKPYDPVGGDFFTFDKFGIVQRSTTSATQNPTNTYSVTFSNVTYTGGTTLGSGSGVGAGAVPEPTTAALALMFSLAAVAFGRRSR